MQNLSETKEYENIFKINEKLKSFFPNKLEKLKKPIEIISCEKYKELKLSLLEIHSNEFDKNNKFPF